MNYNVGDKVLIKSIDWYNKNKDANGDVLCFYGVHKFTKEMSKFCNKTVTISTNLTGDGEYLIKDDDETNWWTDEMIEGLMESIDCKKCGLTRMSTRCLFMDNCPHNKQKTIIEIPEDWVLKDENGDAILTSKIILEKKKNEYPKTYEECAEIIAELTGSDCNPKGCMGYMSVQLTALQKLLICRDAYWKIAGEEMGLDGPWEPDWNNVSDKYCIYFVSGDAWLEKCQTRQCLFAFPTAEMRDAFKENFDTDLEICKELL